MDKELPLNYSEDKIVYLFVHKWKNLLGSDIFAFGGHPKEGRVYRAIENSGLYRIPINIKNEESTGIIIHGLNSEGKREDARWNYDVEIITEDNIYNLNILPEDMKRINKWNESENKDIKHLYGDNVERKDVRKIGVGKPPRNDKGLENGGGETISEDSYNEPDFNNIVNKVLGAMYPERNSDINNLLENIENKDPVIFGAIFDVLKYTDEHLTEKEADEYADIMRYNLSKYADPILSLKAFKEIRKFIKKKDTKNILSAILYLVFIVANNSKFIDNGN